LVLAYDFLDTMAWDVAISAVLLAVGSLTLPYNAQEGRIDDKARNMRLGFAITGGASGFYLFLSGVSISLLWPFTLAGGVYNILFGGIATLGGLTVLAGSIALAINVDLRPITYFASVVGIYAIIDAYAIIQHNLTNVPMVSALGYLSFAAPAILSVPVARLGDKRWRILFAVFAFLFATAWLIQAATFTLAHLAP
jgi:uncharacterized membrane protein